MPDLSKMTAKQVGGRIATIPAIPPSQFSEQRWPHTYAYDYIRTHPDAFGVDRTAARADVAALLRDNPDKQEILVMCATQYCVDNNITIPAAYVR